MADAHGDDVAAPDLSPREEFDHKFGDLYGPHLLLPQEQHS